MVGAWAGVYDNVNKNWVNPFHVGDPIPGIASVSWADDAIGSWLDTSVPGSYPIKKNGMDCGMLTVSPALPVSEVTVTNPVGLYAALLSANSTTLTIIKMAGGEYLVDTPYSAPYHGVNVQGNVRIIAQGRVVIRMANVPAGQAFFNMIGGDLYIEGCTFYGAMFSMRGTNRLTLTDCFFGDKLAGQNVGGYGTAFHYFTAIRCATLAGGGVYASDQALLFDCDFTNPFNYPHNLQISGGNVAVQRCRFNGSSRGIIIGNGVGIIIDDCQFTNITGPGNARENILVENSAAVSGLAITRSLFNVSTGQAFSIAAQKPITSTIFAQNRIYSRQYAITIYNQTATGAVDGVAVFGNFVDGVSSALIASNRGPGARNAPLGPSPLNVVGGNNLLTNQTPEPSHIGLPNMAAGEYNGSPNRYSDCVVVKLPQGNALKTVADVFTPDQVGVECKNIVGGVTCTFTLTQLIDPKTMLFGGWANPYNTGPVPVFNVAGVVPVFTDTGAGNDVAWIVCKPFTKNFQCGDAKVVVR
jgi:hypothetical protein